jgi:phosphoribosylformylglycinamidine synthase
VRAEVPAVQGDGETFGDVAALFGESASRVVVSVDPVALPELIELARAANVPAASIGVVGGDRLCFSVGGRAVIDEPVADAERVWATSIGARFERGRAVA